jgi:ketosteroid isomerase-like protein
MTSSGPVSAPPQTGGRVVGIAMVELPGRSALEDGTMRESKGVKEALLRFYERNSANDQASFPLVVSREEAVLIVGSAAREWFQGQAAVRGAFGLEGFRIEAGDILAWENGDTGWAVNTPTFVMPDGATTMRLRMTTIFVKEDGAWKLVHIHGSTPVPDEVYMEHQSEWWPPTTV